MSSFDNTDTGTIDVRSLTKPEKLFIRAKTHYDSSNELYVAWLERRNGFDDILTSVFDSSEMQQDRRFDWVSFMGLSMSEKETSMLRKMRRERRKAERLLKRVGRLEGSVLTLDSLKEAVDDHHSYPTM